MRIPSEVAVFSVIVVICLGVPALLTYLGFNKPLDIAANQVQYETVEVGGRTCIVATFHLSVAIDCEEPQ